MNYVLFGSPKFPTIILERLMRAGLIPKAVVCNPDRPAGRKKIVTPPEIKRFISKQELGIRNQIKILQPENLESVIPDVCSLVPDLFIVASFSKIIPKEILDIPKLGTIGVHPSLLPKYRGATPIQSVILNGEAGTGTTLYLMDKKMDHGPIIAQQELEISNFPAGSEARQERQFPRYKRGSSRTAISKITYSELHDKLADLSAELLIQTLPKFLNGEITPKEQDHSQATFTKKFETKDGFIEFDDLEKAQTICGETTIIIDRKVRALTPEPGVWTLRQDQGKSQRMKILETEMGSEGKLKLKRIQFEGKTPINL